jgi:hypothetical protein
MREKGEAGASRGGRKESGGKLRREKERWEKGEAVARRGGKKDWREKGEAGDRK